MIDGYIMLAAAVIERAVWELKNGNRVEQMQVRWEILNGGLEYWIEAVIENYDVEDHVRSELMRLVDALVA